MVKGAVALNYEGCAAVLARNNVAARIVCKTSTCGDARGDFSVARCCSTSSASRHDRDSSCWELLSKRSSSSALDALAGHAASTPKHPLLRDHALATATVAPQPPPDTRSSPNQSTTLRQVCEQNPRQCTSYQHERLCLCAVQLWRRICSRLACNAES